MRPLPEVRQLPQQTSSNQKRQTHIQLIYSLSVLLISSVFLYVSSGVFCVQ